VRRSRSARSTPRIHEATNTGPSTGVMARVRLDGRCR
jgi:hypothetical protein